MIPEMPKIRNGVI